MEQIRVIFSRIHKAEIKSNTKKCSFRFKDISCLRYIYLLVMLLNLILGKHNV